jgi:hypothetical protein
MKPHGLRRCLMALFALGLLAASQRGNSADKTVLRGWLSDEGCARGRAQSGTYTQTNPDCAKECVATGKKIVFIEVEHKRILLIRNQDAARQNIGDQVEITGEVDAGAKTVQIDSLKMIEKGRAMCEAPKKAK